METKRTPGDWESFTVEIKGQKALAIGNAKMKESNAKRIGTDVVCLVSPLEKMTDEDLANAQLLQSAPALLEALKYVQSVIKNSDQWWMDSPDKGGFDSELIDSVVKNATTLNINTPEQPITQK